MKLLLLLSLLAHVFVAKAADDSFGTEHHTREYMGSVKNAQGRPVYHLVNHFYTVQAAIVAHGHSELLVYDGRWRLIDKYVVDMPDDLPVLLRRNILYFQKRSAKGDIIKNRQLINPKAPLPKCVCVEPHNDCYFR
jgi:hypothetical protein